MTQAMDWQEAIPLEIPAKDRLEREMEKALRPIRYVSSLSLLRSISLALTLSFACSLSL